MNGNALDQPLIDVVTASMPTTIDEVLNVMKEIDLVLPSSDGLKWFNLLYLLVTKEVLDNPPQNGWLRTGITFAWPDSCLSKALVISMS